MTLVRTRRDGRVIETWRASDPPPVVVDRSASQPELPAWVIQLLLADTSEVVRAAASRYRIAQPVKYRAIEDALFCGIWLALPVAYAGRGIVYMFYAPRAEAKAKAFVKLKNAELKK